MKPIGIFIAYKPSRPPPAARGSVLSAASRREMARRHWTSPHSRVERHYGLGIISGRCGGWDWFPADELPTVARIDGPVKVDGVLDEAAWQQALVIDMAYEVEPGENVPAPVRTAPEASSRSRRPRVLSVIVPLRWETPYRTRGPPSPSGAELGPDLKGAEEEEQDHRGYQQSGRQRTVAETVPYPFAAAVEEQQDQGQQQDEQEAECVLQGRAPPGHSWWSAFTGSTFAARCAG